jgi:hypothetical protein
VDRAFDPGLKFKGALGLFHFPGEGRQQGQIDVFALQRHPHPLPAQGVAEGHQGEGDGEMAVPGQGRPPGPGLQAAVEAQAVVPVAEGGPERLKIHLLIAARSQADLTLE